MADVFRWDGGKLVVAVPADKLTRGQAIVSEWLGSWAFVAHTPEHLANLAQRIDCELERRLTERRLEAVEAIRSEIERQRNEDHARAPYADCDDMSDATLDGHFDLVAVARAVVAVSE